MKNPTSFRLSRTALLQLKDLADLLGLSRAAVLEVAIRKMARDEGVSPPEVLGAPVPRGERDPRGPKAYS